MDLPQSGKNAWKLKKGNRTKSPFPGPNISLIKGPNLEKCKLGFEGTWNKNKTFLTPLSSKPKKR